MTAQVQCPSCYGRGYYNSKFLCGDCGGRGWQEMRLWDEDCADERIGWLRRNMPHLYADPRKEEQEKQEDAK